MNADIGVNKILVALLNVTCVLTNTILNLVSLIKAACDAVSMYIDKFIVIYCIPIHFLILGISVIVLSQW